MILSEKQGSVPAEIGEPSPGHAQNEMQDTFSHSVFFLSTFGFQAALWKAMLAAAGGPQPMLQFWRSCLVPKEHPIITAIKVSRSRNEINVHHIFLLQLSGYQRSLLWWLSRM